MQASEALDQFKKAIEELEATGQNSVPTVNLKSYLAVLTQDAVRQEAGQATMSSEQASRQLEIWKTKIGVGSEMLKATIEAGQTALKSAIIINGGAAVSMLAFVGNAITKSDLRPGSPLLTHTGVALFIFMIGTGLAGTSTAIRYLSQHCYQDASYDNASPLWRLWGNRFAVASVVLGVGSFASFFAGGYLAFRAVVLP